MIKRVIKAGFKYLTNPEYRFLIDANRGKYNQLSDEEFIRRKFKALMGETLDLENPITFSAKLQWLKLYNRKPEYTVMVDKYLVRQYIADKIGEDYLIPLIGVWDNPQEIDFDALPNRFVLKCNHNSGTGMCICRDKSKLNIERVKIELNKGLQEDYFAINREWPYKNVPRKIIAEKYMEDVVHETLLDYKVLCFNGEPKLIEIHKGRFSKQHTQDFYTTNWERLPITQKGLSLSNELEAKPLLLDEMLRLSKILSTGIPHVRVDWYIIDKKLYFGELTFFDGSGFDPFDNRKDDITIGSWLQLPNQV